MGYCKGRICKFPSFFLRFDCVCKLKGEGCSLPRDCSRLSSFAGGAGWRTSAGGGQAEHESAVKANHVPGCISKTVASRSRKRSFSLLGMHEAPGELFPGVGPQYADTGENPEEGHQHGYRSGAHDVWREAEGSGLVQPGTEEHGGDLIAVLNHIRRGILEKMETDSSHRCPAKGEEAKRRTSWNKEHFNWT